MIDDTKHVPELLAALMEHPDLPVIVLAPSTPSDFSTYYHHLWRVYTERLLFPQEVEELYGGYFGLSDERYYSDECEVQEAVECYLWDEQQATYDPKTKSWLPGRAAEQMDEDEWGEVYRPIAAMMVDDMPWHEYVVIDVE